MLLIADDKWILTGESDPAETETEYKTHTKTNNRQFISKYTNNF